MALGSIPGQRTEILQDSWSSWGRKKRCTLVSSSILGRLFNFSRLRRNPTPALLETLSASAGVFPWGNTLSMLLRSPPRKSGDKPAALPAPFSGTIRKAFSFQLEGQSGPPAASNSVLFNPGRGAGVRDEHLQF